MASVTAEFPVCVTEQTFPFLIDTGASHLLLSRLLARGVVLSSEMVSAIGIGGH